MKLIFCPKCGDIFNLELDIEKFCFCGKSGGGYLEDKRTVEVTEESKVFCIGNESFVRAIKNTKDNSFVGFNFTAWVLPKNNRWRKIK